MIETVPSSPTLRQRLNMGGKTGWAKVIMEESVKLLGCLQAPVTPCLRELVPLDIDVTPFDNSCTKKEGVNRTYKGVDGFAPIFAYLGEEGYGVNVELREGKDHSQNDTPSFLAKSIEYARQVTGSKLLVRMDSGFDSLDNIKVCIKAKMAHGHPEPYYPGVTAGVSCPALQAKFWATLSVVFNVSTNICFTFCHVARGNRAGCEWISFRAV